uniref:RNA helicase n=1 Tax=uncultured Helicobacter sp. TaxID=175537 RepID=A0A650EK31_9HELI|nr:hypothetical protein Helico4rc_0550 [uncultured Helicobacter sp.]
MESSDISLQEALVQGADSYYQYLVANDLGLDEMGINAYEIKGEELILELKGRVFDMDLKISSALFLRVGEKLYPIGENENIESAFYDETSKKLYLSFTSDFAPLIQKAHKESLPLALFSDLKFLVSNVQTFFERFGDRVALPTHIDFNELEYIERLSEEQNEALKIVLQSPLSYVWGPPGTGKTQAVLFEALLYYIKQGKKVCVVATTNNALEQVLSTLIKQFDTLGFERSMILRLGTPTLKFMNAFSEVCDPSILMQKGAMTLFNFQNDLKTRLKSSLVVGVTLDGFIKRYESLELRFSHIFLDECAFAPLIKTCALCVDNTPLGFFGDHKQLTPVCEMPHNELNKPENLYANLWNLSSLYLELFLQDYQDSHFYQTRLSSEPKFEHTQMIKLSKTHRYGNNLASILDQYIYHIGLKGNDKQTELFVLDSGVKSESDTHISENEARLCANLCAYLENEDYAVITPFVKQRQRLFTHRINRERIFTIHSSQGQEFDNVIFSPVGLHYHLTNSRQLHALYALNVAISRIKKRLFIVCDYAFWTHQHGQLIRAIIEQSTKIDISDIARRLK